MVKVLEVPQMLKTVLQSIQKPKSSIMEELKTIKTTTIFKTNQNATTHPHMLPHFWVFEAGTAACSRLLLVNLGFFSWHIYWSEACQLSVIIC